MGLLGGDDKRMTFTEHLGELRVRLIRIVIGFALVFTLCLVLWQYLFELLSHPLITITSPPDPNAVASQVDASAVASQVKWITIRPMESMSVALRLAMTCGIFVCTPHIIYEICAFVFPGLKPNERRMALFLIVGCSVLALFGAAVAYFLVLPQLINLMKDWTPEIVTQQLQMADTIDFEVFLLLAFAAAFQFPMILMILLFLGIVTRDSLKQYRRHAIVLLSIAAAAITPTTDPISFLAMWVPLALMYEGCIWISYFFERKKKPA